MTDVVRYKFFLKDLYNVSFLQSAHSESLLKSFMFFKRNKQFKHSTHKYALLSGNLMVIFFSLTQKLTVVTSVHPK